MVEYLYFLAPIGALAALIYAWILSGKVYKCPEGTEKMRSVASAIRRGANAYLKRQYRGVAIFFAAAFVVLLVLAFLKLLSPFVPFAFLTGGFYSGLAGFIGMKIATSANARTANAAHESLDKGLRVAFSAGAVMSFTVVGLGILDISVWFAILKFGFCLGAGEIASTMVMFGMGASSLALFARVGGGIFTKAADVGADLVGKVEAGIPEDDPRNPAVIADNVGDNVGDVAGMGADLYESYVGSILATFALGAVAGYGWSGLMLPLILSVCGIVASIIGTFFIRTRENADQKALLRTLRTGTYAAAILQAAAAAPITWFVAKSSDAMAENTWGIFLSVLCGLAAGCVIGYFTEYFTSDTYSPTKKLAAASETGTATVMIGGISLGMKSTVIPVVAVGAAVVGSFFLAGGSKSFDCGLYGIGISAVGMLSTLGITLATDAYGPVADNAGGIAQMSGLGEEVRKRTDALDSLGNTTAATGKGFAIGSAALTALALLVSYVNLAKEKGASIDISLTNPPVLIGLFVGAMLAFLFAALTMSAVQRSAGCVVIEVRRQFREIKGIMEEDVTPEYEKCVDICAKNAQKEMLLPAIISIIIPIVTGLLLGVNGVVGLLGGVTSAGFVLAVFLSNSGGAWDNAKKFIENGNFGGKGSENHKAAVIGDTVGDPFKDTAGPSLNILIKLVSTVSIAFVGLIATVSVL